MNKMNAILVIFHKEITDAMRDRRALLMVLLSSLIVVPLLLLIVSEVMSQVESQEVKRIVLVVNLKQAPSLESILFNF